MPLVKSLYQCRFLFAFLNHGPPSINSISLYVYHYDDTAGFRVSVSVCDLLPNTGKKRIKLDLFLLFDISLGV